MMQMYRAQEANDVGSGLPNASPDVLLSVCVKETLERLLVACGVKLVAAPLLKIYDGGPSRRFCSNLLKIPFDPRFL